MRTLCRADDIREGEARGFRSVPPHGVFVVRRSGRLFVWRDACPHYGDTPLAWRQHEYLNAARDRIVCAAHGAQFEIDTGRCTLGPCLGDSLQAVAHAVTPDGWLTIEQDFSPQETQT